MLAILALLIAAPVGAADQASIDACVARHVPPSLPLPQRLDAIERAGRICYYLIGDVQRLRQQQVTNDIYENQIYQGRILLFMVVFLTLSGVALAAAQLWASYTLALHGNGQLAEGTDLSLSSSSVAVKSSVVGVVILVVSLAFFFLFLKEVYRIQPPDPQAAPESSNGAAGASPPPPPPPPGMNEVAR